MSKVFDLMDKHIIENPTNKQLEEYDQKVLSSRKELLIAKSEFSGRSSGVFLALFLSLIALYIAANSAIISANQMWMDAEGDHRSLSNYVNESINVPMSLAAIISFAVVVISLIWELKIAAPSRAASKVCEHRIN